MIPDKNIPSNVPAPPMLAIGAPRSAILLRLRRSAPISLNLEDTHLSDTFSAFLDSSGGDCCA